MPEYTAPTNAVLAERLKGLRDDLEETRTAVRDALGHISALERSVNRMIDAQKAARDAEQRQYRSMANRIALGGLAMSVALVILALATILTHNH